MDKVPAGLIRLSYVSLGFLFLGALLLQILLPIVALMLGDDYSEVKSLSIPYSAAAIAAILVAEIGLVVIGMLIHSYTRGCLFAPQVRHWVDALCICIFLAPAIATLTSAHLLFVVQIGGLGAMLLFYACLVLTLSCTSFALLLRRIYLDAAAKEFELQGVI